MNPESKCEGVVDPIKVAAARYLTRPAAPAEKPKCPMCGMEKKNGAPTCGAATCRNRHREDRAVVAMREAKVPARYSGARLTQFSSSVRSRIENASGDIFITGPNGVGKTHLASAALAHRGHGDWILIPELLMRIRNSFQSREGAETEQQIVREISAFDFLVLDDLGAEKTSDWSLSTLYLILAKRVNAMRVTVVTSNLDIAEIAASEPRIASRLAGFERIKLEGKDRRLST